MVTKKIEKRWSHETDEGAAVHEDEEDPSREQDSSFDDIMDSMITDGLRNDSNKSDDVFMNFDYDGTGVGEDAIRSLSGMSDLSIGLFGDGRGLGMGSTGLGLGMIGTGPAFEFGAGSAPFLWRD